MSKTPQEMVLEFHRAFDVPVGSWRISRSEMRERIQRRINLVKEEYSELMDELIYAQDGLVDWVGLVKELADLTYVLYGTAIELGIDLDRAVTAVHVSNMSKLGPDGEPIFRADGKVLKGPNYEPPDLSSVGL